MCVECVHAATARGRTRATRRGSACRWMGPSMQRHGRLTPCVALALRRSAAAHIRATLAAAPWVGLVPRRRPATTLLVRRRHALLLMTGIGTMSGWIKAEQLSQPSAAEAAKEKEEETMIQRQKAKNAELVAAAISGDAAAITSHIMQGADPDSCDDGTEWG
eukprot:COSAG02_NODE_21968_length_768_cov_0.846039_1_plen_161_part_01